MKCSECETRDIAHVEVRLADAPEVRSVLTAAAFVAAAAARALSGDDSDLESALANYRRVVADVAVPAPQ